ncbi:hypothetical protein C6542_15115 [Escherichia coli]|nr:hypothetical protein C5099_07525 [Escherichia coli]AVV74658.1 hypothetical protein C5098_07680 [Escherichia coli]EAA3117920.1 hypothetical protein [Escherichia coli]EGD4442340.1 hypothetical protein [Escherichia coli]EGE3480004.1 hypothetical protein [Escherichia coli]
MCCVCVRSPQSLTHVSSWGFTRLSPSCNSNYLEYILVILQVAYAATRIIKRLKGLAVYEHRGIQVLTCNA